MDQTHPQDVVSSRIKTTRGSAESSAEAAYCQVATHLDQLLLDQVPTEQTHARSLAAILEMLTAVMAATSEKADQTLVDLAREYTGCHLVVLGAQQASTGMRLRAVSSATDVNASSSRARLLKAVLDEASKHDGYLQFSADSASPVELPNHHELSNELNSPTIVSIGLRDREGKVAGVLAFVGLPSNQTQQQLRTWLAVAAEPLGCCLAIRDAARSGPWRRLFVTVTSHLRRHRTWAVVGSAALALFVGWCVELPYRVGADCVLQPVTRRYVAAPFDGELENCLVKPGDLVAANQVLGRMKRDTIASELAAVSAEAERAAKDRDVHLAAGKVAATQMAALELERLEHRRQLLTRRIANLEMKSPLSGVVISSDLQHSEGAPVTTGQSLFEIAPLDRMLCEIAVPQSEISHLAIDQPVTLSFEADRSGSWHGTLRAIHPRSELRDDKNVFIAEVELENQSGQLRPGMSGRAKISTASQPIAWIAFHKPWHWLQSWLR